MADDPVNQQQFEEDVLAAAGEDGSMNMGGPDGNFKMPSVEEVWKLIEQMDGISDEERASLKESLYNPAEGTAEDFIKRYAQPAAVGHTSWDYMIFFAMLVIIMLIFGKIYYFESKMLRKNIQEKTYFLLKERNIAKICTFFIRDYRIFFCGQRLISSN